MPPSPLRRLSEHVYWLPPADPDRPSLAAVVGSSRTLMLDIGASPAHTGSFLGLLEASALPRPAGAVLTHWHWDHVFGMAAAGAPVLAHTKTAEQLAVLAAYDWSDAALDARVQTGEEAEMCARDIKLELPAPRTVVLRQPDLVFDGGLELNLGGVSCRVLHVGGDHAEDACIVYVRPDRVVFLGDCLYEAIYAPERYYTPHNLFPLLETVLTLDAEFYVAGHSSEVMTRSDLQALAQQLRTAYERAARADEKPIDPAPNEEAAYYQQLFTVGLRLGANSDER